MNAEELKALQAPIKERYKKDPATAVVTLRTCASLGSATASSVNSCKPPLPRTRPIAAAW